MVWIPERRYLLDRNRGYATQFRICDGQWFKAVLHIIEDFGICCVFCFFSKVFNDYAHFFT